MAKLRLNFSPPIETEWSIEVDPTADGVAITIELPVGADGKRFSAVFHADRAEARTFGNAVLAAAGDAAARTFRTPSAGEG